MDNQDLIELIKDASEPLMLRVSGSSMFPFLKAGDKVKVRKESLSKVPAGSLIIYQEGGRLFSHRLIQKIKGKEKYFFLEKGDNTLNFSLRGEDDYLGKVEKIESQEKIKDLERFPQVFFNKIFLIWDLLLINLIRFKRNLAF